MTRIRIQPYKAGSRSARSLAEALDGRVLRLRNSRYQRNPRDVIINWGAGESPYRGINVLNQPEAIRLAANKLTAFQRMRQANVNVPDFYTNARDIPADAYPIFARTVLSGHSGRGIVICNTPNDIIPAPLYVRYIKKLHEYRIHVFQNPTNGNTSIIAMQRKAKRNGDPNRDFMIRNHDNGFVFVRDGVNPPAPVIEQARAAIVALGLNFGGVDVIWNERRGEAYVLEVNTACGLEGQTITDYANAIREFTHGAR